MAKRNAEEMVKVHEAKVAAARRRLASARDPLIADLRAMRDDLLNFPWRSMDIGKDTKAVGPCVAAIEAEIVVREGRALAGEAAQPEEPATDVGNAP